MNDATHSITVLIGRLQSSKRADYDDAAQQLWNRYMHRLLDLARQQLSSRVRQREDEHDVLQSAFKSFCQRHQERQFDLKDRDGLWGLLVRIVENKASNVAKKHARARRNAFAEAQNQPASSGDTSAGILDGFDDCAPDPAEAAALVEVIEARLAALDDTLRRIALWKLEGWTDREIAAPDKLDCAIKTVERKMKLIREKWSKEFPEDSSA